MSSKTRFYVGAPDSGSLDWDDEAQLLHVFAEPFVRFARLRWGQGPSTVPTVSNLPSTSSPRPEWRSLPLERQQFATGLSRDHGWQAGAQEASFFAVSEINAFMDDPSQKVLQESFASSTESVEQVLSQFYEESYARHEGVASSQIAAASDINASFTTIGSSSSTTGVSLESSASHAQKDVPVSGPLSNLRDVPNAGYLNSIHPQVMTINIIVGIISLPPPRPIKTRRGANVELIEALVGDGTKSGFGISFWLSSSPVADGGLRSAVEALRPQDVVLMRNIALSSFRGRVYGQSLRRGLTKIHLLYRSRVDHADIGGCYSAADLKPGGSVHPQIEKARDVREWVLRFIGAPTGQAKCKERAVGHPESLPPDTQ